MASQKLLQVDPTGLMRQGDSFVVFSTFSLELQKCILISFPELWVLWEGEELEVEGVTL